MDVVYSNMQFNIKLSISEIFWKCATNRDVASLLQRFLGDTVVTYKVGRSLNDNYMYLYANSIRRYGLDTKAYSNKK